MLFSYAFSVNALSGGHNVCEFTHYGATHRVNTHKKKSPQTYIRGLMFALVSGFGFVLRSGTSRQFLNKSVLARAEIGDPFLGLINPSLRFRLTLFPQGNAALERQDLAGGFPLPTVKLDTIRNLGLNIPVDCLDLWMVGQLLTESLSLERIGAFLRLLRQFRRATMLATHLSNSLVYGTRRLALYGP